MNKREAWKAYEKATAEACKACDKATAEPWKTYENTGYYYIPETIKNTMSKGD